MMAISKEHVDRYASERRTRHSELATYARLEWGGHTDWLRTLMRAASRPRLRVGRIRIWARPQHEARPEPTVAAPAVLLERVRIQEGLDILISVGLPEMAAAGTLEFPQHGEDRFEADLPLSP